MIIEIDGYYTQCLLACDLNISHQELSENYRIAKDLCSKTKDIPMQLKILLNLREVLEFEGLRVDYVVDTDTEMIYTPRY